MNIFISYRRSDTPDVSGRIYDELVRHFGDDTVFKDVDDIPLGVNFSSFLNDIVQQSSVMLIVIGSNWLGVTDDRGQRRLDQPDDFVRIEVKAALEREIPIIPLLVQGAPMPQQGELPEELATLSLYNGIRIRPDPDFHWDMGRLVRQLERYVTPTDVPPKPPETTPSDDETGEQEEPVGRERRSWLVWVWALGALVIVALIIALVIQAVNKSRKTQTVVTSIETPDAVVPTPTYTLTPTYTPVDTPTATERAALTSTPTAAMTARPVLPTPAPSPSPTPSPSPSATHTIVVQTPTSTPAPEPTPTPTPTQPPPTPQSPSTQAWEGTITVNTYGWEAALIDTQPGDKIYPYPRLARHLVQPPQPREYKTVVLENEYLRLTLLPELGGRIYRWLDKASGQEMFYANPVIKPTEWGARGWWLATGGMEWGFPVDQHGLVEWRPWSYEILRTARGVGVRMSDTEDRTGLALEVTVMVEAGRAGYTVQPRITNPTDAEKSYQFWLIGMFALSPANHPSPDLRFMLPVDTVLVRTTGDKRLPKPNESISWPIYEGIDLSRYGTWEGYLGVLAREASYVGAYDPTSDMGVARVYPPAVSQGAYIFGPGTLDPGLWTDDGSGYVELWGGLTPTFWDYTTLAPGASVTWQEWWYGLNGLGGLSFANEQAALWLAPGEGEVQVGALTTRPLAGQLALLRDGETVQTWEAVFGPDAPFRATHPLEGDGRWRLRLVDGEGHLVAAYTDTQ